MTVKTKREGREGRCGFLVLAGWLAGWLSRCRCGRTKAQKIFQVTCLCHAAEHDSTIKQRPHDLVRHLCWSVT